MQRKRGGNNWIGIVIFLAIVVGPPVARALSQLIFQVSGASVDPNILLGGMIVLAVVVSLLGSLARGLGQINSGSETRLPTTPSLPPTMRQPPRSASLPPTMRSTIGQQTKLPGRPQFEPIIDPRILAFGLVGLLFFGGIFVLVLLISGGI